ncbi:hypothetical protein J6590_063384 [Homalodisca vitripennis]|nr:hypothetical protein J6590_063384 [Homalodisca vitripennis]
MTSEPTVINCPPLSPSHLASIVRRYSVAQLSLWCNSSTAGSKSKTVVVVCYRVTAKRSKRHVDLQRGSQ